MWTKLTKKKWKRQVMRGTWIIRIKIYYNVTIIWNNEVFICSGNYESWEQSGNSRNKMFIYIHSIMRYHVNDKCNTQNHWGSTELTINNSRMFLIRKQIYYFWIRAIQQVNKIWIWFWTLEKEREIPRRTSLGVSYG